MKIYPLLLICLFNLFFSAGLSAQNLFTEKIDHVCDISNFCVDCGDPKATCDQFTLDYISTMINHRYNFKGGSAEITFQVLVDSTGFCCVLSHTDVTHSQLTGDLIRFLNGNLWRPAIVNGKPVDASVDVVFKIENGKISGEMKRMDLAELKDPGKPTIYNKEYQYTNPSLSKYNFSVFTKYNSPLPDNAGQACAVDKYDTLWYATAHGLTRFDGKNFSPVDERNSPFTATTSVYAIAIDKDNNKWMSANRSVYMCNDAGWRLFDSTRSVIAGTHRIIANPSGEIFFTSNKGVLIIRNEKMRLLDNQAILDLPSNNVYYAYYDKRERLWIGTSRGSIMLGAKQKVTVFNSSHTPLDNECITDIAEDENGNLYFSLSSCDKTGGDNDGDGIAVLKANGQWLHFDDKNSGMPSNIVNSLWYDKFEHVLWIGTRESGLVRFDLKDGWENYNNGNSPMPGYAVYQIAGDSKGVIYAATANGLVMIKKKS